MLNETSKKVMQDLIETSEKLVDEGQFIPLSELKSGYELFNQKFGPEKLKDLDGKLLIDTMFNMNNRGSMVYWLEFKNDEEFKNNMFTYGSIAGGSSFKYIMFKRKRDDNWVSGSPSNQSILDEEEAIELGRKIRDSLVLGAELIEDTGKEDYSELQKELENRLTNNMANLGWVHKYYHIIYPNKIEAFHNTSWQRHALICSNIKPEGENELYTLSGQLMKFIKETNINSSYITNSMVNFFGGAIDYFRIETTRGDNSHWDEMLENNYISIGWSKIGDLSIYSDEKFMKIKKDLKKKLEEKYPNKPQVIGKNANEIISFYKKMKSRDIVVVVEGEKVLGIGKVDEDYRYLKDLDCPHVVPVEWINNSDIKLPNPKEGLKTNVYEYKDIDNILEIQRLSNIKNIESGRSDGISSRKVKLEPLSETSEEIKRVLERKKQVILYGPPGTGKTYHAEKTCLELASRNRFEKEFNSLSSNEKNDILGDGRTNGLVRICCFHPSYGYEDFIEGIKPSVIDNKTAFDLKDGIFKDLCKDAEKNPKNKFYLIIDEINRGDISRIFGELIMLIESGKRGKSIILPMSSDIFKIPENIYIVGTMNTADRSIALLDAALRRRFGFIELMPDYTLFKDSIIEGLPLNKWLRELNSNIVKHVGNDGRNLQIGHSYFLENEKPIRSKNKFKYIIKEDIIPLIEEYSYGDYTLMSDILGEGIINSEKQVIRKELFDSSDISDLITALLSPYPHLREDVQEIEDEDEEDLADNGVEDEK